MCGSLPHLNFVTFSENKLMLIKRGPLFSLKGSKKNPPGMMPGEKNFLGKNNVNLKVDEVIKDF